MLDNYNYATISYPGKEELESKASSYSINLPALPLPSLEVMEGAVQYETALGFLKWCPCQLLLGVDLHYRNKIYKKVYQT